MLIRCVFTFLSLVAVVGGSVSSVRAEPKPRVASLEDFSVCAEQWDADGCLDGLRGFIKKNPGAALAAGRLVTNHMNHAAAMPFFDQGLPGKGDRKKCADDRLASAAVAALTLSNTRKDNPLVMAAERVLVQKCWAELLPVVKKAALEGRGYLTDNLCPILASKNESSPACAPKAEEGPAAAPAKWLALDPNKVEADGTAKVYRGNEGRRVTMVKVKNQPAAFLVKFEGVRGPFNGRVVLHRERPAGLGVDYFTQIEGSDYVSVVAREGWGGLAYDIYPKGDGGPFAVAYDEEASKKADAGSLVRELR